MTAAPSGFRPWAPGGPFLSGLNAEGSPREVRERLAAAICALAQKRHNALLSAMRKNASLYVRAKAEAALTRIKAERQS
jgi:hypothetical protein